MVLIVDDRDVLSDLAMALRDAATRSRPPAMAQTRSTKQSRPTGLVTDVLMPILDGIALAKALRLNAATAAIRIVLSSGVPEGSIRALFDDYDAFLEKPYDLEDLRQTAAALLAR
jgi:CheY-like chemotaxis protein